MRSGKKYSVHCKAYSLLISFFHAQIFMKTHLGLTVLTFSILLVSSFGFSNIAFAEEYDFVAGIHNEVTFHFRDGVETVNFPVFSTTTDIVSNVGSSFEVEGVVGDNPHLHRALDQAYLYRMSTLTAGAAYDFNYRYFDADVNVVQNGVVLKSFSYVNCEISEYGISTLTDDYESYLASNTGFAIVNNIDFRCGGVHINPLDESVYNKDPSLTNVDYGQLPFKQAENVRTFLTFDFDHGSEKIESVIFTLTSGFDESDNAGASFQIITAVLPHPLIDNAIEKSQKLSGLESGFNEDFDVLVSFENPEDQLRGIDFHDCIVSGYDILTLRDKEEGYTGKRGFATAEVLDVDCSGLSPLNPQYDKLSFSRNTPILVSDLNNSYNMGTGPHVIATFDFAEGFEVVDFTEFFQGNLIAKASPTFELVRVPGKTPLLYEAVDRSLKAQGKSTGASTIAELFDVNLVLMYGDTVVRGFDYSNCRIVDYVLKTEHDAEESFYKGFALTNEFHFECLGYKPFDPMYDAMFEIPKADTMSSLEWQAKQRNSWGPLFSYS